MKHVDSGAFLDEFPYLRIGTGSKPLVVVPGIDDSMFDGEYSTWMGWAAYPYFARYTGDYSVYLVSRPRGLAPDSDMTTLADGYASVLSRELGQADVLGVSMSGQISLELGIRHPDLVDRLVVANSGCRITDLEAVERFRRYAIDHDWERIRAELAVAMFSDWRAATYPPLAMTAGRYVLPKPADPRDVLVSLDAIAAYDATDRLDEVSVPTLVFGGTEDPYFPPSVLETTAAGIPEAELALAAGGKHAAFHERKHTFDRAVTSFLSRRGKTAIESTTAP